MNILLNQEFKRDNLVYQSGKYSTDEFQKVIQDMIMNFKDYAVVSNECLITTTKSVEIVDGKQIIDVEVLLPISCRVSVGEPYKFKERFIITNALNTKVEKAEELSEVMNEVNTYIISNGLQPITSAYLVQTKQMNKLVTELYIGINQKDQSKSNTNKYQRNI